MSDSPHQNDSFLYIYIYTDTCIYTCILIHLLSFRGYRFRSWRSGNCDTRFYLFFIFPCYGYYPGFSRFIPILPSVPWVCGFPAMEEETESGSSYWKERREPLTLLGGLCACKGVCKPMNIPGPESWMMYTPFCSLLGGRKSIEYRKRS